MSIFSINCLDLDKWKTVAPKMMDSSPAIQYYFGDRALLFDIGILAFPTYCLVYPDRTVKFIHGDSSEVVRTLTALMD